MSNKLQILRSSSAGKKVTAGTYPSGTPWVNFADKRFGIIGPDPGQIPIDLIAVTFFAGTADYEIGDVVIDSGKLYRAKRQVQGVVGGVFNISDWDEIGAGGAAVTVAATAPATPKTGDLWYDDTKDGRTYVWDGIQWVDAAPASNLGIKAFDATQTYALNDQVIQTGKLYVAKGAVPAGTFQPTQWNAVDDYVQKAGDTMTGKLTIAHLASTSAFQVRNPANTNTFFNVQGGNVSAPNIFTNSFISTQKSFTDITNINFSGSTSPLNGGSYAGFAATAQGVIGSCRDTRVTASNVAASKGDVRFFLSGQTGEPGVVIYQDAPQTEDCFRVEDYAFTTKVKITAAGTLHAQGAYSPISDRRLKENIVDDTVGLAEIKKLQPRVFDYIGSLKREHGFIAQEIQNDFPEAFCPGDDVNYKENPHSYSQGPIINALVNAIQELTTRLEALEAK
jgi:hypothetical protein